MIFSDKSFNIFEILRNALIFDLLIAMFSVQLSIKKTFMPHAISSYTLNTTAHILFITFKNYFKIHLEII